MDENKTKEGFSAGKILKEKYVIDEQIGDGGMGLVYLAHDINNARHRFVVKTLKKKALNNEYAAKHFQQEGEALGRINHDGVVKLFNHGEDEETRLPFLVIEFAEGETLTKIIEREPMSLEKCADLVRKIAFALTAVHKADVLHRDLKPDNIMVVESSYEQDKIKIIDFGVAIVRDSIHAPTTVYDDKKFVGTPAYASPEQLLKNETTGGEVFSLAIIAYEMLTGKMAFPAASHESARELHRRGIKEKPSEIRNELSSYVDEVIIKGLALDPDVRYQTPIEFADALADAVRKSEAIPPTKQKSAFEKILTALLLLVIGSVTGTIIYYFWLQNNKPETPVLAASPSPGKTNSSQNNVFSYFFKIQKMKDNLPSGKEFLSPDSGSISEGDKFEINITREQNGNFYLIEETTDTLRLLFPLDETSRNANPQYWAILNKAKKQRFWLIWSKNRISEFETLEPESYQMRSFLERSFDVNAVEAKKDDAATRISGLKDLVIYRLSFN